MREETEQSVILQPVVPVEAASESQLGRKRWMRFFLAESTSPDSASVIDLQRRACWIGVALILQALNEATLLVLVYFPLVPLLAPWASLISFGLIAGSIIALWIAFRPAPLRQKEVVMAQRRPRR